MSRTLIALAASLVLASAAYEAGAHTRSVSYSIWELSESDARVRVRISLLELSRLGVVRGRDLDAPRTAAYLVERLRLRAGTEACLPDAEPVRRATRDGWVVFSWRVRCPPVGPRSIQSRLLGEEAPGHLHFARVIDAGGRSREQILKSDGEPWRFAEVAGVEGGAARDSGSGGSFLALGVEHILTGWDHLVFLLGLLILASSLSEVVRLVTGFTIAHSVTLGLATLGVLDPEVRVVEALIGFSIALVAAENAWLYAGRGPGLPRVAVGGILLAAVLAALGHGVVPPMVWLGLGLFSACHFGLLRRAPRPERLRVAVAFAFGLVHGFGFAGVLAELALPTDHLVPALFAFNCGVEIGQLAIVCVLWPALRWIGRWSTRVQERLVVEVGSAAICGIGVYWLVSRSYE